VQPEHDVGEGVASSSCRAPVGGGVAVSVVDGVENELGKLPVDLRESGLAAVARAMAERIDEGKGSPSECGKVVIEALTKLRELAPPEEKKGELHDLRAGRSLRLASGGAGG
jgi:hypothetical protein